MRNLINQYIHIISTIILIACGTNSSKKDKTNVPLDATNSAKIEQIKSSKEIHLEEDTFDTEGDTIETENATFFIIVADTSLDYYTLHKKMFFLNKQLTIKIDTMGRHYNETKKLIALPDNDEDKMYAGDYFPRRFPSENLSLEYLSSYKNEAVAKTIALVTGIYETEKSADSALFVLEKIEKKAFKIKADIYIGCLH